MSERSYRTRDGYWYRRVQPENVRDRLTLRDLAEMVGLTIFLLIFLIGPVYAMAFAAAAQQAAR